MVGGQCLCIFYFFYFSQNFSFSDTSSSVGRTGLSEQRQGRKDIAKDWEGNFDNIVSDALNKWTLSPTINRFSYVA